MGGADHHDRELPGEYLRLGIVKNEPLRGVRAPAADEVVHALSFLIFIDGGLR
jgi:hypothetical protein